MKCLKNTYSFLFLFLIYIALFLASGPEEEKEPCCLVATPFILLATERALLDAGTRILKKSYWRGEKSKGNIYFPSKGYAGSEG